MKTFPVSRFLIQLFTYTVSYVYQLFCTKDTILSQQFRSISCNSITISKYIYSLKTIRHIFLSEEE